jgi:serine/threonine-protein kinase HipA
MIQPRHFLLTAKAIAFSQKQAEQILAEMLEQAGQIAEQVATRLPPGFPHYISEPILGGMIQLAKQQLRLGLGTCSLP